MKIEGCVALVTGGNRGIGEGFVQELLEAGAAKVYIAARKMADAKEAATADPRLVPIQLDVTKQEEIASAAQTASDLTLLINNAGVFDANPIDRDDDAWVAEWDRTMRINLTASAELCRLAVLHWQSRGVGGRIVNIASRAAYRGDSPAHWHYAASKAGMVAMTKSIARGYAGQEILAFAVCPGFTMTGMADDYLSSRGGDKLLADIPLGRVAMPDEIAAPMSVCA